MVKKIILYIKGGCFQMKYFFNMEFKILAKKGKTKKMANLISKKKISLTDTGPDQLISCIELA